MHIVRTNTGDFAWFRFAGVESTLLIQWKYKLNGNSSSLVKIHIFFANDCSRAHTCFATNKTDKDGERVRGKKTSVIFILIMKFFFKLKCFFLILFNFSPKKVIKQYFSIYNNTKSVLHKIASPRVSVNYLNNPKKGKKWKFCFVAVVFVQKN